MLTAIVLAAGQGARMKTEVPKQFLDVGGVPMIVRTLRVFEESPCVDEILLTVSPDRVERCREEIVEKYGFRKIRAVVAGGRERTDSVRLSLDACPDSEYVMIHDGARPFVTPEILERTADAVRKYGAVAVGMPSKDTVKIADADGFVSSTPDRRFVWTIQTPQAFSTRIIREAGEILRKEGGMDGITDDAMLVERSGLAKVRLIEGSYANIKITTPEDLRLL